MGRASLPVINESVPLDQHAAEIAKQLTDNARKLFEQLQLWSPVSFNEIDGVMKYSYEGWMKDLSVEFLSQCIASVQSYFQTNILNASNDTTEAHARLKDVLHAPYLEILVKDGSGTRETCDDDCLRLTAHAIAVHMEQRIKMEKKNFIHTYFAWCAIAAFLLECPDLLPQFWMRIDKVHHEAELFIKYEND